MTERADDDTNSLLRPLQPGERLISLHTLESLPSSERLIDNQSAHNSNTSITSHVTSPRTKPEREVFCRSCQEAEKGTCAYYAHEVLAQYLDGIWPDAAHDEHAGYIGSLSSLKIPQDDADGTQDRLSTGQHDESNPNQIAIHVQSPSSSDTYGSSNYITSADECGTNGTRFSTDQSTAPSGPHSSPGDPQRHRLIFPSNPYLNKVSTVYIAPKRFKPAVDDCEPSEAPEAEDVGRARISLSGPRTPRMLETLPALIYRPGSVSADVAPDIKSLATATSPAHDTISDCNHIVQQERSLIVPYSFPSIESSDEASEFRQYLATFQIFRGTELNVEV
ncbi:MAG: hypothetical protein Q9159_003044 [Coniocarpon cinnabarinum]